MVAVPSPMPPDALIPDADTASPPAIEVSGLRKVYAPSGGAPPKEALCGIDLRIPRGSFFGLLGPNGAGKSTLINILAGLVVKTEGRVRILGVDIDRNPRRARRLIGVVPQELNLDAFFTPRETLEYQAGLYGVPRADRRTDHLLEALGLMDKAHAYARSLSGGMRRRLLVAKALVHAPPVVVLDEPTAGVDVELRRSLWAYMKDLNARGITVVLTTHYLEEAERLCDRIAILDRGRIVACDAKHRLMRRLDEKELLLWLEPQPRRVPEQLAGFPARIEPDGTLRVCFRPSRTAAGEVLERLREAGFFVRDLRSVEPDLETLFLRLTGSAASSAADHNQRSRSP